MYTYNVIEEATRALSSAQIARASDLVFEAHCLLTRTYCFHLVGKALDNLHSAREHLDAARKLRPGLAWAETLLDLARKIQLVSPNDLSWRPLYVEILDSIEEAKAQGLHQAAREHAGSAAAGCSVPSQGSIPVEEEALSKAGERMLTRELALLADRLGKQYVERGWSGDRERALHCFQAAERSFYYLNVDPEVRARNQLHLASWFIGAEVSDAEDFDYVLTKALNAVCLAAALTPPQRYPDAHAASWLVAAQAYEAAGQDEQAIACLRQGLEVALPGGRSWRDLRARLTGHNLSLF